MTTPPGPSREGEHPQDLIGSGWAPRPSPAAPPPVGPAGVSPESDRTTVLPSPQQLGNDQRSGSRPPPVRPALARTPRPGALNRPSGGSMTPARPGGSGKNRRARLALQRIDPWSVFLLTFVVSVFLGIALVVAVFTLYTVLGALGVEDTLNRLYADISGTAGGPLLSASRFVEVAAVLAAVNVVLLTLMATLGALLYNLCASFTGGIEVTLGERDGS